MAGHADGLTGDTMRKTNLLHLGALLPEGDGTDGSGGAGKDTGKSDDGKTFTQADLDRIVSERITRERGKFADYDDLKAKAQQLSTLEAASRTDQERAVEEARATARREALAEATPRVVAAEFRAAAKGVLTPEQTTALLEDIDLSKFVNDKGEVDEERIAKKIGAFAPAKDEKRRAPDLGQGRRADAPVGAKDIAREQIAKRFPQTTK